MILKPQENHFKKLPSDLDALDIGSRSISTLIVVKSSGEISRDAETYDEDSGDVAIFAWAGQWRTDVFILDKADLEKHYHAPMRERLEQKIRDKENKQKQKQKNAKKGINEANRIIAVQEREIKDQYHGRFWFWAFILSVPFQAIFGEFLRGFWHGVF